MTLKTEMTLAEASNLANEIHSDVDLLLLRLAGFDCWRSCRGQVLHRFAGASRDGSGQARRARPQYGARAVD